MRCGWALNQRRPKWFFIYFICIPKGGCAPEGPKVHLLLWKSPSLPLLKAPGCYCCHLCRLLPFSNWGFVRLFSHLEVRRVLDIFNRSRLGILGKEPRFLFFFKILMLKFVYFGGTSFFQIHLKIRQRRFLVLLTQVDFPNNFDANDQIIII